jgi:hypothetical protein
LEPVFYRICWMLLLICRKCRGWYGIIGFGVLNIYGSGGGLSCAMHWSCLWMEYGTASVRKQRC